LAQRGDDHAPQWKAYRRQISSGLLAVMRLDAANRAIEDYVLLPAPLRTGRYVWLSSESLHRHRGALYKDKGALFGAIKAGLAKTFGAAPASSGPSEKRSRSGKPKAKGFGGRAVTLQRETSDLLVRSYPFGRPKSSMARTQIFAGSLRPVCPISMIFLAINSVSGSFRSCTPIVRRACS
jgi:hypothetical protein